MEKSDSSTALCHYCDFCSFQCPQLPTSGDPTHYPETGLADNYRTWGPQLSGAEPACDEQIDSALWQWWPILLLWPIHLA